MARHWQTYTFLPIQCLKILFFEDFSLLDEILLNQQGFALVELILFQPEMSRGERATIDAEEFKNFTFKLLDPTPEKLKELTALIADSFFHLNPIWGKLNASIKEVHEVFEQRLKFNVENGAMIHVMENPKNGEIVMATTSFDLASYLKNKYVLKGNYPWWGIIERVSKELEDPFFENYNSTEMNIYGDIGAANMKYANFKNTELFWNLICHDLKSRGFRKIYGRASNKIVTKILCDYFGGQRIRRTYLKGQGLENEFMDLFELDLETLPAPGTRVTKPKL